MLEGAAQSGDGSLLGRAAHAGLERAQRACTYFGFVPVPAPAEGGDVAGPRRSAIDRPAGVVADLAVSYMVVKLLLPLRLAACMAWTPAVAAMLVKRAGATTRLARRAGNER